MKKLFIAVLCLGVAAFFVNVFAAEHPGTSVGSEHPGTVAQEEHKEHPGKTHAEEHPGKKELLSAKEIIKAIKDHINEVTAANNGYYPLTDAKEGKDLKLKLVKVHEDKVSYIEKHNAYFACTDFVTADGTAKYDVDFWMKKAKDGKLEVYEKKIHKKDGTPRFTYKNDEVCPVK